MTDRPAPPLPAANRTELAIDAIVLALPSLATLALYLPSGLLMPFRLALVLLVIGALVAWWRRRAVSRALVAVLVLAGVWAVSGAVAAVRYPQRIRWDAAAQTAFLLLAALALAQFGRRRRTVIALAAGWVVAGLLAAPAGLWEWGTGRYLPKNGPAAEYGPLPGLGVASWFDNPNLYAYQCVVVLLLLPAIWTLVRGPARWLLLPLAAVVAALLYQTGSELGLGALALGALLWLLRRRITRLAVVAVAGGAGLAVAVLPVLRAALSARLASEVALAGEYGTSTWKRLRLAETGGWIAQQTSYLGTGPGGFGSWARQADNPFPAQGFVNAHWGMVEVLSEYGVLSLGVLLALLAAAVWYLGRAAGRRSRRSADGALLHAGAVLAAVVPVVSATHSSWLSQPLTALHLATIALLVSFAESGEALGVDPRAPR